MNKILTLVALLIGFGSVNISQAQSDPAAKQILDGVSAKFKTFKAVQSGFTLKVEDGKGKVQGEKSGVVFMKGGKYRVNISGQEIYSDGTNVWTYDKGANEVTITKMEGGQNSLTPQKLFTNFYDKDFLYKLNGEKKVGNRQMQEIELTPIDKSKAFHKVYLLVDKAQKSIFSAKILEKNGNVYTYTVSNFNGKAVIPDAQFVFDKKKYPGVEEIDLR
ncbi:LolA-like putative outer membrane lipoprotein chaperone [Flavihumibacter cheonanensis]|jgi:outer membrane lipoprotein carrier protein|uniref:LolA family protein n=1 Tax=Flavihumibacter cheonanensis TaxID=1442385 RepID=UPI001EF8705A|nr:outer membrane lipoprotein carrier protein LolA [Flavihumibacter cheonanensis]MCG7752467.1 outer membrane lipoprotein carrier protein LolA [Flavihumibacter cheonanensis]